MIVIELVSYKGRPVEGTLRAQFDTAGGTIGRARDSTLLLPDPSRMISRTHATVELQGGRFLLRDQGTAVPVVVNGRPVGRGNVQPIAQGDELRIGDCTLRVTVPSSMDHEALADAPTMVLEGAGSSPRTESGASLPPHPAEPDPLPPIGASPPAEPGAHDDELLAALLRGAGVGDMEVPGGLSPRLMEDIGVIMRETVQGLRDLLAARAQAKREVSADETIEMPSQNNPLKFSPELDAVIAHLLAPRGQAFMAPLKSLTDAHESLRTHHEGFVAGMRAALAGVLGRFDPAELERRFAEVEGRGPVLPMTHKARLWSLYEALYGTMSREAETDFHGLFGEDFLRAYQAQTGGPARPRPSGDAT